MPRDWIGRTTLKWAILCPVGHITLTQSVSQYWISVHAVVDYSIVCMQCPANTCWCLDRLPVIHSGLKTHTGCWCVLGLWTLHLLLCKLWSIAVGFFGVITCRVLSSEHCVIKKGWEFIMFTCSKNIIGVTINNVWFLCLLLRCVIQLFITRNSHICWYSCYTVHVNVNVVS